MGDDAAATEAAPAGTEADDNASGDKGAGPSEENENGDDAKDQDTAN